MPKKKRFKKKKFINKEVEEIKNEILEEDKDIYKEKIQELISNYAKFLEEGTLEEKLQNEMIDYTLDPVTKNIKFSYDSINFLVEKNANGIRKIKIGVENQKKISISLNRKAILQENKHALKIKEKDNIDQEQKIISFAENEVILNQGKHPGNRDFLEACEGKATRVMKATGQLQWGPFNLSYPPSVPPNQRINPNARWGSGFLISPHHFVTAGHCVAPTNGVDKNGNPDYFTPFNDAKPPQQLDAYNLALLMQVNFNYQDSYVGANDAKKHAKIYCVDSLIEYKYDGNIDYAILVLKNAPGNQHGYVDVSFKCLMHGQDIFIWQHPEGKPKKLDYGMFDQYLDQEEGAFTYCTVNTLGGSSGSPVAINDNQVAGIHTGGQQQTANHAISLYAINKHSLSLFSIIDSRPSFSAVSKKIVSSQVPAQNTNSPAAVPAQNTNSQVATPAQNTNSQITPPKNKNPQAIILAPGPNIGLFAERAVKELYKRLKSCCSIS